MRLQFYDIIPALQPYVKSVCSMDCDEEADTRYIRVLPDACVEIFVNYTTTPVAIIEGELHKQSIVTFRMSQARDVQMRKGSGCLAVCFYPGKAYPFFRIPMHVVTDTTTDLCDLWRDGEMKIEEVLANARDNGARADFLQRHLVQLLARHQGDLHLEYCLKQVEDSGGLLTVAELADRSGWSQRHLSRKFQQYLGLSPKEYLRVNRFLRSLSHLKKHPSWSLTALAYESGYYDQAHFNRDYKEYTGCSPGELIQANYFLY
ncbi:helix-turn-helix domain-containing protein [Pedobacter sp. SYSU D00535]|uniref:helix-turn-helix domain-containing protein n=1 Tax=Pedobacter sp. SYSU D00535 TaxID=2810308 RepID=UPI001A96138A|nr:helix-turn-helix domain-containing protein [Pedobacter sp. SYSU D00535]